MTASDMSRLRQNNLERFTLSLIHISAVYFRPLPLADTLSGGDQLMVTLFEVEISDGQPDVEYPKYDQLTQEQQTRIRELFAESSYRRTLGTLFSDGSMDGLGDRTAYVHVLSLIHI